MTLIRLIPFALTAGILVFRAGRVVGILSAGTGTERLTAVALSLTVLWLGYRAFRPRVGPTSTALEIASAFTITLLAVAFFAPIISPWDPLQMELTNLLAAPSASHWFGTDSLGRDYFARNLFALRTSLTIALLSMAATIALGTAVGTTAALHPRLDGPLMRAVDVGMAFPRVILLLVLFTFWNQISVPAMVAILALTGWYEISRLIRSETLVVASQDFFTAARSLGLNPWLRTTRHVVPNLAPVISVNVAFGVANIMLIESGLAYLGIAIPVPQPSLGRMINDGTEFFWTDPRMALIPGLAIVLTALAFGYLADRVQLVMDPRTR